MSLASLEQEYRAALKRTSWDDLQPLREAGVCGPGLAIGPAIERIIVNSDRLYQPDPEAGLPAFLIPVRVFSPVTPEAPNPVEAVRSGAIVDLLAIDPKYPARWALRTGAAEWIGAMPPQYMPPCPPVSVWRTPIAWLRAGGEGLVLLHPFSGPGHRILLICDEICAEDHDHARLIRSALEQPWPIPPIRSGDGRRERRHAA
jgi:hypothetical protein